MSNDPIIFKVLSGIQVGVEVALADGTYLLGSSADDDIQLIDVSLLAGHARLRIAGGKIETAAQAGSLQLGSGETLVADKGWRTLDPLEVITGGTTRFALGARSANWASVTDDRQRVTASADAESPSAPAGLVGGRVSLIAPILALIFVATFGVWFLLTGGRLPLSAATRAEELHQVRTALDAFPFGKPVQTRQDVDGAIYVTGYVTTPVERRALAGALDKTEVPAHVRLFVLDDMRREIADLISGEKSAVTFVLADDGELTLDGLILPVVRERRLIDLLRDSVRGISTIRSNIKTANSLLEDVRQLVASSQLKSWLLLRLDDDMIEVSGALPSDKVDAWVGFLQTYATRFAGDIALRSFVQLQTPGGEMVRAPGAGLTLGSPSKNRGETALDLERLKRGDFSARDIFVGSRGTDRAGPTRPPNAGDDQAVAIQPARSRAVAGVDPSLSDQRDSTASFSPKPAVIDAGATGDAPARDDPRAQADPTAGSRSTPSPEQPDGSAQLAANRPMPDDHVIRGLADRAAQVLQRFRHGAPSSDPTDQAIERAIALLESRQNGATTDTSSDASIVDWYLPLSRTAPQSPGGASPCWAGSALTSSDLLPVLFWLDVLSASRIVTLATFEQDQQILLLEAAMNPKEVQACSRQLATASSAADHSLYLREVSLNPAFVGFVVRDLPTTDIGVAGVSFGRQRFVITRQGGRMAEGSAPDRATRVAVVGELGLVFQREAGLSVLIFGPDISWTVGQ